LLRSGSEESTVRRQRGFTLIELLVVVAILGIVSSIAIAGLLNALDKGKQKRSMADLRSIAEATEAYHIDQGVYPKGVVLWSDFRSYVSPFFIREPPNGDGWEHTWIVVTDGNGTSYSLVSLGKDGVQGSWIGGMTGSFDCDIVFVDGQFFQWPQGTQS
jgi:general secretion pathway protein G